MYDSGGYVQELGLSLEESRAHLGFLRLHNWIDNRWALCPPLPPSLHPGPFWKAQRPSFTSCPPAPLGCPLTLPSAQEPRRIRGAHALQPGSGAARRRHSAPRVPRSRTRGGRPQRAPIRHAAPQRRPVVAAAHLGAPSSAPHYPPVLAPPPPVWPRPLTAPPRPQVGLLLFALYFSVAEARVWRREGWSRAARPGTWARWLLVALSAAAALVRLAQLGVADRQWTRFVRRRPRRFTSFEQVAQLSAAARGLAASLLFLLLVKVRTGRGGARRGAARSAADVPPP